MKILQASSEVHPYSKTGGLADMVAALSKSLAGSAQEVVLVTPLYRGIRDRFPEIQPFDWHIELPLGPRRVEARVWQIRWQPRLTVYFVDQPGFFDRSAPYQENGRDFADNPERFIFFSKCVVHLARYLAFQPDIVHVHDWQVGLVPALIREQRVHDGWGSAPGTCLTIHNLAYQGLFSRAAFELTNLPLDYFHPGGVEYFGGLNCLKAGIAYADTLTTVSPRYAREILTETLGCGLDPILRERRLSLRGILNGVDYSEWNSRKDPYLDHPFTPRARSGKLLEKLRLQEDLLLARRRNVPLFGSVTRLVDQKGGDILLSALEEMLAADLQFVILGSGESRLERAFVNLARRFPTRAAVKIGYDHALSHRIEAASDFFLMPSRFEPCGLNQMYSLRYGAIPIVRSTGGLDDSIIDPKEDPNNADGIKFYEYSARALAKAMRKALVLYREPELLSRFRNNGMAKDFSWERTSEEYLKVYKSLVPNSTP